MEVEGLERQRCNLADEVRLLLGRQDILPVVETCRERGPSGEKLRLGRAPTVRLIGALDQKAISTRRIIGSLRPSGALGSGL